ncbi:MAG: hypothetical protein KatS3mg016_1714 [Fimbriimonadales bacterium]|nr:MAG: hypothetical protein KatS3mg016_1714 [Fimbriimonadales bacterium]
MANTDPVTLGELVVRAEAIINDCFGTGGSASAGSTGRTQLSNAIDAINQAQGCIELFINWLRYQMSREDFWRTRGKNGSLGEQVYKYAEELRKRDSKNAAQNLTYFLGFLRRALVAMNYLDKIPAQLRGGEPQ